MKNLIINPYFWGVIVIAIGFSILIYKTVKILIELKNEEVKRNI